MAALILATACAAIFFYRVADYEQFSPLLWSLASVGLTGIVFGLGGGLGYTLIVQLMLFGAMWAAVVVRRRNRGG
jgi:hypothetical protein